MSAIGGKADIGGTLPNVRFCAAGLFKNQDQRYDPKRASLRDTYGD